jgi:hypothetical protein
VRDVLDFEDGLTFSSILMMNVDIGRQCLVEQRTFFNTMHCALLSLFDSKAAEVFRDAVSEGLEKADVRKSKPQVRSRRQIEKTISELNKLNVLLR